MAQKKTDKRVGLVGCGTPEVMFKASVRKEFAKVDGVVGIQVRKDKIILRVESEEVAAKLPKSFRKRPIEAVVVGVIRKQAPRK